jgi:NADPH:quinone reductase-like Zn-dependent oxidoreductase
MPQSLPPASTSSQACAEVGRVAEARKLGIEALAIGEPNENSNFNVALDTAGGPVTVTAIAMVRNGGVLAAVADVPEGANAEGRIRIINVLASEDSATLQKIADAAARGDLTIPVAKTLRLSAVGEGHRLLAAGQVGGKIIFIP